MLRNIEACVGKKCGQKLGAGGGTPSPFISAPGDDFLWHIMKANVPKIILFKGGGGLPPPPSLRPQGTIFLIAYYESICSENNFGQGGVSPPPSLRPQGTILLFDDAKDLKRMTAT